MKAEYSGKVYSLSRIEKPKAKKKDALKEDRRHLPRKAGPEHPWKNVKRRGFVYDPRDEELLEGLFNSTIAWENDSY